MTPFTEHPMAGGTGVRPAANADPQSNGPSLIRVMSPTAGVRGHPLCRPLPDIFGADISRPGTESLDQMPPASAGINVWMLGRVMKVQDGSNGGITAPHPRCCLRSSP